MKIDNKLTTIAFAAAFITTAASAQYQDGDGDTIAGLVTGGAGTDLVTDINAADAALGVRIDDEEAARIAADGLLQADVDQNEADSDAADAALGVRIDDEEAARIAADGLLQADIDQNEVDSDAADAALQADIDAEVADRSGLISSTGTNDDGNQIVHIGDNSLVTQELGGEQQLHAEDASGNAIDIVVTNGSDLVVRTQDPAATNSNIGINSGLTPQIVDPDPNDSLVPVVTTRDGIGSEKIDFTNSGVTIAQNGDVTLLQSAGTQLNVELGTVTSFDVDATTGVPIPGSQSWAAGYYTDAAGNIVNVSDFAAAVLADPTTAGDYTFNAIADSRFSSNVDEATLIAQLQAVEPDDAVFNGIVGADGEPLVASTTLPGTGGNLQVGGNANVDGVLSVAGDADPDGDPSTDDGYAAVGNVAEAIGTNADDIAATQADVDQNETDSDAADAALGVRIDDEEAARIAADGLLQADIDQNEVDSDAADAALGVRIDDEEAARIAANLSIRNDFAAADANLQSQIDVNRADIDRNARGIAMVGALTHTTVLPGMTHALDVSAAHFEGETGMAISYSRRIKDGVQINFGAASTTDFDESVVRGGIGWQW
jgi:hypothetical protein